VRVLQKLKERDPSNRQLVFLPITCPRYPRLMCSFF
jgi:hypothetical protein